TAVRQSARGVCRSQRTIRPLTSTASRLKNQRCQPPAEDRKLKAAPVLCTRVQFQKPSITGTDRPYSRACMAQYLLAWSASTSTADRHSQGEASCEGRV